jgi:hypothetical protein
MSPKDIFNLAIRILGLAFLYNALASTPVVILQIANLIRGTAGTNELISVLVIAWQLAVAWWLFGGPQLLLERAYPENAKDESRG